MIHLTSCAPLTIFMMVKLIKRKNSAYRLQYREKCKKYIFGRYDDHITRKKNKFSKI